MVPARRHKEDLFRSLHNLKWRETGRRQTGEAIGVWVGGGVGDEVPVLHRGGKGREEGAGGLKGPMAYRLCASLGGRWAGPWVVHHRRMKLKRRS
jgi:hypothetical protein